MLHASEPDAWIAALLAARRTGARVVLDVHEHYPSRLDATLPRPLRPPARAALRLFCRAAGAAADAVVVAKDGLDADFGVARPHGRGAELRPAGVRRAAPARPGAAPPRPCRRARPRPRLAADAGRAGALPARHDAAPDRPLHRRLGSGVRRPRRGAGRGAPDRAPALAAARRSPGAPGRVRHRPGAVPARRGEPPPRPAAQAVRLHAGRPAGDRARLRRRGRGGGARGRLRRAGGQRRPGRDRRRGGGAGRPAAPRGDGRGRAGARRSAASAGPARPSGWSRFTGWRLRARSPA